MAKKRKAKKSKKIGTTFEVIESYSNICELCKGKLVKIQTKVIGDSEYAVLKCEKCKHIIARHIEKEKSLQDEEKVKIKT